MRPCVFGQAIGARELEIGWCVVPVGRGVLQDVHVESSVVGNDKPITDQVGYFGPYLVEVRRISGVGRSNAVNLNVEVVVPVVGRTDQP